MNSPSAQTALGNAATFDRLGFAARLTEICEQADEEQLIAAVVLDIDRFDTVNSALGHEFGYRVLEVIQQRIQQAFPHYQAISHLGNDEFAVLVGGETRAAVRKLTQAALKAVRQPLMLDDQSLVLTASAGVALWQGGVPGELLQHASIAVTEAQRSGGDSCVFYTKSVQKQPLRRLDLELDLRRALDAGDIRVNYQPIYDLHNKRICGLEALARWKHDDLGWIEPAEFIPLAEESGLIAQIGESVLQTACSDTRELMLSDKGLDYLAVNFAARQIEHRNLVKITERILGRVGFPPAKLVLEITESDFLEAETRIVKSLENLRSLGVRVAIDDFGTGYSSLRVLKEFPADLLKIDRQFVQQAHCDHVDATISRAVIDIAHSLNLQVVAEGVENSAQLDFLKAASCDFIQGFHVGKAVEAAQLQQFLQGKN